MTTLAKLVRCFDVTSANEPARFSPVSAFTAAGAYAHVLHNTEHDDTPATINPERPEPDVTLELADWLAVQAKWYWNRCQEGEPVEGLDLIAARIEYLALSARDNRAVSVSELVNRSVRLRRARLLELDIPDRRDDSLVAQVCDDEARGFLRLGGDAARLVAWWLLDLAAEADYYQSDTSEQYLESHAEERRAAVEAMMGDESDDDIHLWN